ncbi:hypothetical protein EX30DRAFT_7386 [Ascodesmis nigricans]|uniref:MADS-box domain-containing protein n=1 Tax=Ascodesmis nigricans TaxID=341454 RepID=A0A4S2N6C8_9PEZI|nr:hypothetical protein EX30DRAFT_7386 [Ascodesmis nigricans]
MGRRKIEIKPIKDDRNRSVTFLKRKGGLMKKAYELSELCQVDVVVLIYTSQKRLHQFCSGDVKELVGRHAFSTPHESKGPNDFRDKTSAGDDDEDGDHSDSRLGSEQPQNDLAMHSHLQNSGLHQMQRNTASPSPPSMSNGGQFHPMNQPQQRNDALQRRSSSNLMPPNAYSAASQAPQNPSMYAAYNMSYNGGQMSMQPSTLQYQQYSSHPAHQHAQRQQNQPQQEYMSDPRRSSMPPSFSTEHINVSEPERSIKIEPPTLSIPQGLPPTKSRSTFTPIGPSESMLAQHFIGSDSQRARTIDLGAAQRDPQPKNERPPLPPPPQPIDTTAPLPPSRSNSINDPKSAGMRPRLKVQIPVEEEANPQNSPNDPTKPPNPLSARPGTDSNPIPVLPPPSPAGPSSALLSAGATGPSNPFSRPLPVATTGADGTPVSAMPSRLLGNEYISSPISLLCNWEDWKPSQRELLPSPMNLQTPVVGVPQRNEDALNTGNSTLGTKRSEPDLASTPIEPKRIKV